MKRLMVLVLLSACKPSGQEGASRFCARVKPSTPAAQEECSAHYIGLRGFAKDCIDECVTTSADGDAFEGCRESCFGKSPAVQDVCLALGRTDIGCVTHYVTMQKAQPKPYGCAARCVVRDKKEAACASTCGVSAAPASARDPMSIPP